MKFDQEGIKKIIPHRDPMLLVSRVLELAEGGYIETEWDIDKDRAIFEGHFPGDPVLPGVYTVESMAQTADILLLSSERYAGKTPLFLGVNNVSFLKKIEPGSTIRIKANMLKERPEKAIATCYAEVFLGEEMAAKGEVTLAMR